MSVQPGEREPLLGANQNNEECSRFIKMLLFWLVAVDRKIETTSSSNTKDNNGMNLQATSSSNTTDNNGMDLQGAECLQAGSSAQNPATSSSNITDNNGMDLQGTECLQAGSSANNPGDSKSTGMQIKVKFAFGVLLVMIIVSVIALVLYLLCYFADEDHNLRCLSQVCHRLALMSAPIITVSAMLLNYNCDDHPRSLYWRKALKRSTLVKSLKRFEDSTSKVDCYCVIKAIFVGMPILDITLKFIYTIMTFIEICVDLTNIIVLLADVIGVAYFPLFWYVIYLKRISLEMARKKASKEIKKNLSDYNKCIQTIRTLYEDYHPLRQLILPCIYALAFSSAVGFGVILTWNYNTFNHTPKEQRNNVTVRFPPILCSYKCDTAEFMDRLWVKITFNLWILLRHTTTIFLPLCSLSKMDIQFIWEDFKTDLFFMYDENNRDKLTRLTDFANKIHSKASFDTIFNYLMLVIAVTAVLFANQDSNF